MLCRPMLAHRLKDIQAAPYPLLASPKLDGIRGIIHQGRMYSRSLKLIRNQHVQEFAASLPDGLDGELIAGDYSSTQSCIMSSGGGSDFQYRCFDRVHPTLPFCDRLDAVPADLRLPHILVSTPGELQDYLDHLLADEYEGAVLRVPTALYQHHRSRDMLKLKPFRDAEALILGVEEQEQNTNPGVRDPVTGRLRRPGGRRGGLGRAPKGTLGSFRLRDILSGVEFSCGSGMDDALRAAVWADPTAYIGRLVTYRCQDVGTKDRPRFPRFVSFRDPSDMSPAYTPTEGGAV